MVFFMATCNKSYVSFVNVSFVNEPKSHMCTLSMFLKSMSHIVSVLKVMGSKKSFPSKTHKYSTYIFNIYSIMHKNRYKTMIWPFYVIFFAKYIIIFHKTMVTMVKNQLRKSLVKKQHYIVLH